MVTVVQLCMMYEICIGVADVFCLKHSHAGINFVRRFLTAQS